MTDRTHTAGPFLIRGEDLDNPNNALGVEPTNGDGGGWPYFIRQDRDFALGETPLWLAHGIQRLEDARLFAAAPVMLAALRQAYLSLECRSETQRTARIVADAIALATEVQAHG